jgi:hypothetical protein
LEIGKCKLGIGDWGLEFGNWRLGIGIWEKEEARQALLARQNEANHSASQIERLNAQLRRELAALQAEQRELENSTGQVREELKGLSVSSAYGLGSSAPPKSHFLKH